MKNLPNWKMQTLKIEASNFEKLENDKLLNCKIVKLQHAKLRMQTCKITILQFSKNAKFHCGIGNCINA